MAKSCGSLWTFTVCRSLSRRRPARCGSHPANAAGKISLQCPLGYDVFTSILYYVPQIHALVCVLQHTELSECETISRVCFQVAISCLKITVLTRKVTKKFVEHDRIVFVTHSLHQPVFNGRLSSRAAVFREVDRIVVKAGANRQCGDPSSDIRRHILATTGDITSIATEGPDWKAADHHTAGVKTWTWAITRDNESIENVLLQGYCC